MALCSERGQVRGEGRWRFARENERAVAEVVHDRGWWGRLAGEAEESERLTDERGGDGERRSARRRPTPRPTECAVTRPNSKTGYCSRGRQPLTRLGMPKQYNATQPWPWIDMLSTAASGTKSNFFEDRPTSYALAHAGKNAEGGFAFTTDEEF